jgi:hypothetical protein
MFADPTESNPYNQRGNNDHSFRGSGAPTTVALDGRTIISRGASSTLPVNVGFTGELGGGQQRFSRYDQHQRQAAGAVVAGQRVAPTRTIPTVPANGTQISNLQKCNFAF